MSVVTQTPIVLSYFIAEIDTARDTYDSIRWYRSRRGAAGLFEAASAAAASVAAVDGTKLTPHQLHDKIFSFLVNGATRVDVTFADADPVTTAQVVVAINNETALVAASDVGGYLHLETVATGSGASIKILGGDANPFLGFVEDDGAVGLDADTGLAADQHEYLHTDQNSDSTFWYQVELRNSTTFVHSTRSVPFPADAFDHINYDQTIVCYIRLADMQGRPIVGRTISFFNTGIPNTVSGPPSWGIGRLHAQMSTDRNGYAQLRLLRGIQVDMNVTDTGFTRRLTIPVQGDAVNLLDPSLVTTDEYGISEANIDFAIRTS